MLEESKKIIINNENIEPKIDDNGNNVKDNAMITKKYKKPLSKYLKDIKEKHYYFTDNNNKEWEFLEIIGSIKYINLNVVHRYVNLLND